MADFYGSPGGMMGDQLTSGYLNGPGNLASQLNSGFQSANRQNQASIMNARNNQSQLDQLLAQLQGQMALQGMGIQGGLDLNQQNIAGQVGGLKQQGANSLYDLMQQGANNVTGLQQSGSNDVNLAKQQGSTYLSGLQQQGSNSMNLAKEQTARSLGIAGPLFQTLSQMFGGGTGGGSLGGVQGNTGQSAYLPGAQSGNDGASQFNQYHSGPISVNGQTRAQPFGGSAPINNRINWLWNPTQRQPIHPGQGLGR